MTRIVRFVLTCVGVTCLLATAFVLLGALATVEHFVTEPEDTYGLLLTAAVLFLTGLVCLLARHLVRRTT